MNTNNLRSRFCAKPRSLGSAVALGLAVGFATRNLAVGVAIAIVFALIFRRGSCCGNTLPSNP